MSESAIFALLLIAIALGECFVVVPREGFALRASFNRRHRVVPGSGLPGTARRGLAWTNPLPPLGEIFVCGPIEAPGSFDGVAERLQAFRDRTRLLRILCCVLAVIIFVVIPAAALTRGLASTWKPLLAVTLAAHIAVVGVYIVADRALLTRGDRISRLLSIALAPPAAIRAVDVVSRDLFKGWHPVAVAGAVCDRNRFQDFAVRTVRKLRYGPEDSAAGSPALADEIERAASIHLGPSAIWLTAPEPEDPACRSYCPRCLQQYVAASGTCPDCCGIALASF